jgi:hypothetical protein
MGRASREVHAPAGDLDEKQHVQPPEPDRVDREEIDRDQASRLRMKELPARWSPAVTGWAEVFLAEDFPYRGRRHRHAQPFQFTNDALVPPTWILARDSQNEVSDLMIRRPSASSATVRPAPGDQPPMPAEQRGRLDDEGRPDRAPQQPTCRSQEDPVCRREARTPDLAAQDRHLVTEHSELVPLKLVSTDRQ